MKSRRNITEPNYWAAYADCMLALFMIALLLWILSSGKTIFAKVAADTGPPTTTLITEDYEKLLEEIDRLKAELAKHKDAIKNLEELLKADKNVLRLKLAKIVAEKKHLEDRLAKVQADVAKLIAENIKLIAENQKLIAENQKLTAAVAKLIAENQKLTAKVAELEAENKKLTAKVAELEAENKKLNRKFPIIELAEGNRKFRFLSGSASLSEDFRDELRNRKFPDLLKNLQDFPVNTIEIIGHTDGDPMKGIGNLDDRVPDVVLNNAPVAGLKAGSNADLGLMRALAIREAWLKWTTEIRNRKDRRFLESIDIRCYSAAQIIPPDGAVGKNLLKRHAPNQAARRIEIRVTFLEN